MFVKSPNYEVEWHISDGCHLLLNVGSKVRIGTDYTVNDLLHVPNRITCCIINDRAFFAT